ncbi:hypothetical protein K2173_000984 [Erythroxylum novogranatense]|uniref:Uncharacterized protein n=1 Tax=Erythroxylum novogranatense TaxID=1862640 RepID=A0AAV8TSZ4_9ROSI|nr:hypothetical protein K2173_000984 [Erythroxylum novogranatense]
MDREQHELRSYGFFGIFRESFKIIFSWKKIFTQITLAFILPLCVIFFAHFHIAEALFSRINGYRSFLDDDELGSPSYYEVSHFFSKRWIPYWFFKFAYFFILLILSLLATSAVVYAIACIYTSKPVSFKKVMSAVPKVWKRVLVTFLWSFLLVFVFNTIAGALFLLWAVIFSNRGGGIGIVILIILLVLYIAGVVYVAILWHLACVISVLEEIYGIKALKKSRNLIKGKTGAAVGLVIILGLCFGGTETVYQIFVVYVWTLNVGIRFAIGLGCLLLLVMVVLIALVIETVLYLVCKSHHHETIDKPALSEHLEGYNWEYVPLKERNIQMEQV